MDAIILAGGFGTRLRHIVSDAPKPMAQIAGKPFLDYLFEYLSIQGVKKVILAVGYLHNKIEERYRKNFMGIDIEYSVEDRPLGTGGAIKRAMKGCSGDYAAILNGDTFFNADLNAMEQLYTQNRADAVIAVKRMRDFDRYGALKIEKGRIIGFYEKQFCENGLINGGIYILGKHFSMNSEKESFSLEKEYFEMDTAGKKLYAFESDGYFIDIGVESDYFKADGDFHEKSIIFR